MATTEVAVAASPASTLWPVGGSGGSDFVDSRDTNVQLQDGVHSGDGLVKITCDAAPATFTVTNTNDSGVGSLRQAITNANPTELDIMNFAIPASDPHCNSTSGVCTISPTSALPDITQAVSIDGYSQPGASPNTLATGSNAALNTERSGADLGAAEATGIRMTGPRSVVKGLIINRWNDPGVVVTNTCICANASGNTVQGTFIGTDAYGTAALGNRDQGVIIDSAQNNLVGTTAAVRNIISANGADGVIVFGSNARGNRILRNTIFDNGKLGINLRGESDIAGQVSANDAGDADTGPNHFQNHPVIAIEPAWQVACCLPCRSMPSAASIRES